MYYKKKIVCICHTQQCLFHSVKFHLERIVGMTVSLLHWNVNILTVDFGQSTVPIPIIESTLNPHRPKSNWDFRKVLTYQTNTLVIFVSPAKQKKIVVFFFILKTKADTSFCLFLSFGLREAFTLCWKVKEKHYYASII